jgi:hypothetical protein
LRGFLLDSSYLFALYGDEGERTRFATESFTAFFSKNENVLLVPWPVLYESFNSEFSERRDRVERLNSDWSKLRRLKRLEYVDDSRFRQNCLDEWLGSSKEKSGRFRGLSLVDRILMELVEDRSRNVEALLTFDLRDFSGFCGKRKIEIIPGI